MTWKTAKLSSLCTIQSGGTPRRSVRDYWYDGTVPWAKISDLESESGIVEATEESISRQGLAAIGNRLFPKNTVLLAMYGSVGKIAVAGRELTTNQAILGIQNTNPEVLNSRYLIRWLESMRKDLENSARGVTQKNISATIVRELEIPLPPLDEQKRIAAVLDAADALRAKRRAALAKLDTLLQSVFLEMFGDPVTNPMGWEVVKLGDVAEFVGGGTPRRDNPDYYVGDICWATSKDMKGEFLYDTVEHITLKAIEESSTKLVPTGSILVGVKSKILLKRLPLLITRVPTCFSQDIKGIILNNELPTSYTARHLRVGQRSLLSLARGVNTEGLTLRHLSGYSLMLPPRSLVDKYVLIEQVIQDCLSGMYSQLELQDKLFASTQQLVFSP